MFKPLLLCSDNDLQNQLHLMRQMHFYFKNTTCSIPNTAKKSVFSNSNSNSHTSEPLYNYHNITHEEIDKYHESISLIRSTSPEQQDNDSDSYELCTLDTESYEDIPTTVESHV